MCLSHNITTILTDVLTHPAATCCHSQPGYVSPMTLIITRQGNITSRVTLWSSRLNPLCWYNFLTSVSALRTVSIKQPVIFVSGSILRNSLKLEDILFLPCSGCLHRSWWTYLKMRGSVTCCQWWYRRGGNVGVLFRSRRISHDTFLLSVCWFTFVTETSCSPNLHHSWLLSWRVGDNEPHLRPDKSSRRCSLKVSW